MLKIIFSEKLERLFSLACKMIFLCSARSFLMHVLSWLSSRIKKWGGYLWGGRAEEDAANTHTPGMGPHIQDSKHDSLLNEKSFDFSW
jgi:hypothetical protein